MKVTALFKKSGAKTAAPKGGKTSLTKVAKTAVKKAVPKRSGEGGLWLPNTNRPAWLDGSLPGDRGFDPLGLSKPSEYLQFDVDQLDQNAAVNRKGGIVGSFAAVSDEVNPTNQFAPYSEVFGLLRLRECEVIHGRWAMLAALGALVAEANTGISWQDAIGAEVAQPSYVNLDLPFSIDALAYVNPILIGGAELYRNGSTDPETRVYPGGVFDPLRLASEDPERAFKLKEAELKHSRLAMVACLGYLVQALTQGEGALGSLEKFAGSF